MTSQWAEPLAQPTERLGLTGRRVKVWTHIQVSTLWLKSVVGLCNSLWYVSICSSAWHDHKPVPKECGAEAPARHLPARTGTQTLCACFSQKTCCRTPRSVKPRSDLISCFTLKIVLLSNFSFKTIHQSFFTPFISVFIYLYFLFFLNFSLTTSSYLILF